jgi:hypothetical protein
LVTLEEAKAKRDVQVILEGEGFFTIAEEAGVEQDNYLNC